MQTSLSSLVNNLDPSQCNMMNTFFKGSDFNMLLRKGVFPYDYFNSFKKLNDSSLPKASDFYSQLYGTGISDEEYDHAKTVWKKFKMKSLREYHDLYLKTDVLLLADVFENFRVVCMNNYKLDPAWYYTAPGLAWDACLKNTGIQLELISDPDMLLFMEEGIRGGISSIVTRLGQANNPYMGSWDQSQPTKYITYLDANNLYGWAMSKKLPTGNFKWMKEKELKDWFLIPSILKVDLRYPVDLHDAHNELPLAPERLIIKNVEKLIPNLTDKKNYIVHYQSLAQMVNLGMEITKIHSGISFDQSEWMKPYIDLNTELRMKADNPFEKDFFQINE